MIELITSTGYNIVEASWHTAAFFTKFYLLTVLIRSDDSLGVANIDFNPVENMVLDESRIVLAFFLTIGIISVITGFELRPIFTLASEGIALTYLAFLFWKF